MVFLVNKVHQAFPANKVFQASLVRMNMALVAIRVQLVRMVKTEYQVKLVDLANLATLLVFPMSQSAVHLELLEFQVFRVDLVNRDLQEHQAYPVNLEHLGPVDQLDHRVVKASPLSKVAKVKLVTKVKSVTEVSMVIEAFLDPRDRVGQEEKLD